MTLNWPQMPFLRTFRDATGAENGMPPGGSKRTRRAKRPGFAGFQAINPDGKYYGRRSYGLSLEVLADGKYSLREPPSGNAPQRSQGSEAPRPPPRALRAFSRSLETVVRCAEQPDVRALQRRASIF